MKSYGNHFVIDWGKSHNITKTSLRQKYGKSGRIPYQRLVIRIVDMIDSSNRRIMERKDIVLDEGRKYLLRIIDKGICAV